MLIKNFRGLDHEPKEIGQQILQLRISFKEALTIVFVVQEASSRLDKHFTNSIKFFIKIISVDIYNLYFIFKILPIFSMKSIILTHWQS